MNQVSFSIADAIFTVHSNYDVRDDLFGQKAYNIHHNFKLNEVEYAADGHLITLKSVDAEPTLSMDSDSLIVQGRLTPESGTTIERQNSLWGINGPVNKFIIHILETQHNTVTLHATAIVNPTNKQVCLAIGHSGSGKSVLLLNALRDGWKLLSSEYVLIRNDDSSNYLRVYTGSHLDNMSIKSTDQLSRELPEANIMLDNFIKDPLMHKVFVDLSSYLTSENYVDIPSKKLIVSILNIHSQTHRGGELVTNDYFFNRFLQQIANEKVSMPLILNRVILDAIPAGSAAVRNRVVEEIAKQASERTVLGGDADDFNNWLSSHS